jgi:hypothetical protein
MEPLAAVLLSRLEDRDRERGREARETGSINPYLVREALGFSQERERERESVKPRRKARREHAYERDARTSGRV